MDTSTCVAINPTLITCNYGAIGTKIGVVSPFHFSSTQNKYMWVPFNFMPKVIPLPIQILVRLLSPDSTNRQVIEKCKYSEGSHFPENVKLFNSLIYCAGEKSDLPQICSCLKKWYSYILNFQLWAMCHNIRWQACHNSPTCI